MSYDESRRLLHVVMTDGTMATLTAYREEQVSGWTLQQTNGAIRSVATVGESTYALVERVGGVFIEVLDETLQLDCALAGTSETPKQEWSGAGHLEGMVVKVVADGAVCPDALVEGGSITLDQPAQSVQMGLSFTHVIEPLPPSMQAIAAGQGGKTSPHIDHVEAMGDQRSVFGYGTGLGSNSLQAFRRQHPRHAAAFVQR